VKDSLSHIAVERFLEQGEYLPSGRKVQRPDPVVSVCIITYHQARFIEQCLDSALMQQTNFPFEIIVGEDESTDGTREICQRYAEEHPDIIRLFLRQRETSVFYVNDRQVRLNVAWTQMAARGKYMAILEGDDYWTDPHKLQLQVDFLESHPECALCFHPVDVIYEGEAKGEMKRLPQHQPKDFSTLEDLLVGNFISNISVMYRRGLLSTYPEWFFRVPIYDWPLHILYAQHGLIGYIDRVMAEYRIHPDGIWSQKATVEVWVEMMRMYGMINVGFDYKYDSEISRVLRNHYSYQEERATEHREWIAELEEAKDWHAQQTANWQETAERERQTIEELHGWITELETARDWHAQQSANWQHALQDKTAEIEELRSQSLWSLLVERIKRVVR